MTIEERAKEAWLDYCYRADGSLYSTVFEDAYVQGATEALASQWVSVKDALPDFHERVVVRCVEYDGPSMFIAQRIPHDLADLGHTGWHWTQVVRDESITHWMRIPAIKNV